MGSTADNFQGATPDINKQNFASAIQSSQQGLSDTQAQQQKLANALTLQSQGQGPNPALAQLNQTTNANNQASAGMIASQRGLNPALAARLGAETAANNNQTAGGQAATLGAQQQLAAEGALQTNLGTMGGESLQNQSTLQGAQAAQNTAINTGSLGAQGLTADAAKQTAAGNASMIGGAIQGVGSAGAAGLALLSKGGKIPGQPKVPGDSPANDTVKTLLSPGEIVIPRTDSSDPAKAKEFIDHLLKSQDTQDKGYGKVLEAHRKLKLRVAQLEKGARSGGK